MESLRDGGVSKCPPPRDGWARTPGFWSRFSAVPEGLLTIARCFSAGFGLDLVRVPKGRLRSPFRFGRKWTLSRPFGTRVNGGHLPDAKAPGYFHDVPPGRMRIDHRIVPPGRCAVIDMSSPSGRCALIDMTSLRDGCVAIIGSSLRDGCAVINMSSPSGRVGEDAGSFVVEVSSCPGGTFENSPVLQRRVWIRFDSSPEGTTEVAGMNLRDRTVKINVVRQDQPDPG
jgi:hypothetical protein